MSIDKNAGKNISKRKTGSDVPFLDVPPDTAAQTADLNQLANDIYTTPSLGHDGLPDLVAPLQTTQVPVGSIIPHYDFNGMVTIGPAYKYCDGSVIVDAQSPINGQTLPDLSNRYLVGFGTEAGGDIDTAAWLTPAVGIANHQINLQHSHTVNSHNHSSGTLQFQVADSGSSLDFNMYNSGGASSVAMQFSGSTTPGGAGAHLNFFTGPATWFTKNGSGSTGSTSPGTDNQLSTTQSIQPRSIRVRFIMRIK